LRRKPESLAQPLGVWLDSQSKQELSQPRRRLQGARGKKQCRVSRLAALIEFGEQRGFSDACRAVKEKAFSSAEQRLKAGEFSLAVEEWRGGFAQTKNPYAQQGRRSYHPLRGLGELHRRS